MAKIRTFISETVDEMKHKVTWPKYSELQSSSILVLVASLIFALLIGLFDLVFESSLEWFYSQF